MLKNAWEKTGHLIIITGIFVLVYFVGSGAWVENLHARWYWMIAIMTAFVIIIGLTTNGRPDGALIDWRNKLGLARLQVTLWTIIGMSAFLTIGLGRIAIKDQIVYDPETAFAHSKAIGGAECLDGIAEADVTEEVLDECPAPDALQVIFPEELLLAMGISVASFAGSSLVKRSQSNTTLVSADTELNIKEEIRKVNQAKATAASKVEKLLAEIGDLETKLEEAQKKNKEKDIESAETMLQEKNAELKAEQKIVEDAVKKIADKEKELVDVGKARDASTGLLHVRKKPEDAEWSDLFTKEISGEETLIDLSKLQMFFFTITIIFAYSAAVNDLMRHPEMIENPFGVALPLFSASLVVLLGISHGGYLAIKNTSAVASTPKK